MRWIGRPVNFRITSMGVWPILSVISGFAGGMIAAMVAAAFRGIGWETPRRTTPRHVSEDGP
jgi:hypothetical protein